MRDAYTTREPIPLRGIRPRPCTDETIEPGRLCIGAAGVGPARAVAEAAHLGRRQAEVVRVHHVVDADQSQVRDPHGPAAVTLVVVVGPEPVADGVPDANLELDE